MTYTSRLQGSLIQAGLFIILPLIALSAMAQDARPALPDHAQPTRYGSGWECVAGYRKVDDRCAPIELPGNAYLTNTAFGTGWQCERGYLESRGECVAIEVPANGYLTERAYKPGWKCERGFKIENNDCVALDIPDNGHIDYSGHDWVCDRPFTREGETCTLN